MRVFKGVSAEWNLSRTLSLPRKAVSTKMVSLPDVPDVPAAVFRLGFDAVARNARRVTNAALDPATWSTETARIGVEGLKSMFLQQGVYGLLYGSWDTVLLLSPEAYMPFEMCMTHLVCSILRGQITSDLWAWTLYPLFYFAVSQVSVSLAVNMVTGLLGCQLDPARRAWP